MVQHSDSGDFGVVGDADAADVVVPAGGDLPGATSSVGIEPSVRVAGIWKRVVGRIVVRRLRVVVVPEVRRILKLKNYSDITFI